MDEVSLFRLYLLRAMYLFIVVGIAAMIWPLLLREPSAAEHFRGVTWCLLSTVAVLSLIGIRYPLKMLPVLFFELIWKVMWVLLIALPLRSAGPLQGDFADTWFNTMMGAVLLPFIIPWGYVVRHYLRAPGDRWRSGRSAALPPPFRPIVPPILQPGRRRLDGLEHLDDDLRIAVEDPEDPREAAHLDPRRHQRRPEGVGEALDAANPRGKDRDLEGAARRHHLRHVDQSVGDHAERRLVRSKLVGDLAEVAAGEHAGERDPDERSVEVEMVGHRPQS